MNPNETTPSEPAVPVSKQATYAQLHRLIDRLAEATDDIAELKVENAALRAQIETLERRNATLRAECAQILRLAQISRYATTDEPA